MAGTLFDIVALEPLVEFHIPQEVVFHHTWKMYNHHDTLQALYAHPQSETYETFDGALYHKKTQTLLYVPRGKTSLHIPKHIKAIGYEALICPGLKSISVDPENPYFRVVDGNLYSHTMEELYYAAPNDTKLMISSMIKRIDSSVFFRSFSDVIVSNDNPCFKGIDGVLYRENDIVYICDGVQSIYLDADVNIWSLCRVRNVDNLSKIEISENHPRFQAIDNIIYNKDCTEVIYIPKKTQRLFLPDQLVTLKNVQFEKYNELKEISIHKNTYFTAHSFKQLNHECLISIRIDEHKTIELPQIPVSILAKCIQFLRGAGAEIKSGTELFYLDCYFFGLNHSPEFYRVLQVSSWQIIQRVILENDLSRMEKMLMDERLITKKNIKRALNFAIQCGNITMCELLKDKSDCSSKNCELDYE